MRDSVDLASSGTVSASRRKSWISGTQRITISGVGAHVVKYRIRSTKWADSTLAMNQLARRLRKAGYEEGDAIELILAKPLSGRLSTSHLTSLIDMAGLMGASQLILPDQDHRHLMEQATRRGARWNVRMGFRFQEERT